jgi:hypothetical protein
MVPKQGQTTIAEYDQRVGKANTGRLATLPVPVSQRGIVAPAWEVQVYRGPDARRGSGAAEGFGNGAPRPARREREDDWSKSIFRGW